jgi:hypothetical protein
MFGKYAGPAGDDRRNTCPRVAARILAAYDSRRIDRKTDEYDRFARLIRVKRGVLDALSKPVHRVDCVGRTELARDHIGKRRARRQHANRVGTGRNRTGCLRN